MQRTIKFMETKSSPSQDTHIATDTADHNFPDSTPSALQVLPNASFALRFTVNKGRIVEQGVSSCFSSNTGRRKLDLFMGPGDLQDLGLGYSQALLTQSVLEAQTFLLLCDWSNQQAQSGKHFTAPPELQPGSPQDGDDFALHALVQHCTFQERLPRDDWLKAACGLRTPQLRVWR